MKQSCRVFIYANYLHKQNLKILTSEHMLYYRHTIEIYYLISEPANHSHSEVRKSALVRKLNAAWQITLALKAPRRHLLSELLLNMNIQIAECG